MLPSGIFVVNLGKLGKSETLNVLTLKIKNGY